MNKIVMKKENIQLDYKYKSWTDVCKVLEVSPTRNMKQKKRYLEELKLSFDFKQNGNSYIFTSIKDLEAHREDNRKNNGHHENSRNNNSVYTPYTIPLMLDYFRRLNKDIIYTTNTTLAEEIGVVNENYSTSKIHTKQFNQYIYEKYNLCNTTAKKDLWYNIKGMISTDIVENTLKKLKREENIDYEKGYLIQTQIHNEKITTEVHLADCEEKKIINSVREKVVKEMGYNDIKEIKGEERVEFYRQCGIRAKKAFDEYHDKLQIGYIVEFDRYYVGYKINVIEEIKSIDDIGKLQFELNDIIIERAYDKFVRQQKKQIKENNERFSDLSELINLYGDLFKQWEKDRIKSNYLEDAKKLIEVVLKKGYRKIKLRK